VRVPILDARRAELFAAAYDRQGVELLAPCALPLQEARARLETLGSHLVFVGGFAEALGPDVPLLRGPDYDLPQARWVGIVASNAAVDEYPALPIYVRGAGATLPNLPPSPISSSPRGTG
jgi:tRNA A37 threonylcarbamoyladenosine modification protein TsaB